MATYQFSALADGQAISFNPSTDVLNFDQTFYQAAEIRVTVEGANLRIGLPGSKEVVLLGTSQLQVATTNVTFASGGRMLFGDNTVGTANDNAANSLVGTAGRDHLAGFGGADTLNGGAGDDTYFVSTGDVLVDSSGVDSVFSDVSWSLGAGFENLTFIGTANASAQGNSLSNSLTGNAGNNYFNGRGGNDTIDGGAGNDTIDMSTGGGLTQGHDIILGGDGIDTVDYDGYARSAVVADLGQGWVTGGGDAGEGTARLIAIERLVGGAFNDQLSGDAAANYLDGRGGNDTIDGRDGNDTLLGGTGADTFLFSVSPGSANADQVVGFVSGSDKLILNGVEHLQSGPSGAFAAGDARFWSSASGTAHDASDRVIYNTSTGQLWYDADGNGSAAAQLIATLQGAPALAATDIAIVDGGTTTVGTAGNDSLTGTAGNDTMQGLGGNDTLRGEGGADRLEGGDGDDSLYGGHHFDGDRADYYVGGNGNDTLDGDAASFSDSDPYAETMDGGLGDDLYVVDNAGDVLIDAGGIDTVRAVNISYTLGAGFENLHINNDEAEFLMTGIGNELDNFMRGGWGVRLEGRGGNDTLMGTSRDDQLFGDEGNDFLNGDGRSDMLEGGAGNDTLYGSWDDDTLSGGAGDDWLDGDASGFFIGASDSDVLTGGAGADTFGFSTNPYESDFFAADTITDFASGVDTLRFNAEAMPALGASGRFSAGDGRFHAAAGATSGHDADDRLIYNTTTRELFYDADGSGSTEAVHIATLQAGASLAATDIFVDNGSSGQHVTGTNFDDSLSGGDGDDTIEGFGGNDTLDGGLGADSMNGGGGNDLLVGAETEQPSAADTMEGGAGNDTFSVSVNDVISDSGGIDTVIANFSHRDPQPPVWTLGEGFENLTLFSSGDTASGIGNSLDNIVDGSGVYQASVSGLGGDDWLTVGRGTADGGEGDDVVSGDAAATLHGGAGNDGLFGTAFGAMHGDGGNDYLFTERGGGGWEMLGGEGNDTLSSGSAMDTMEGGAGADQFQVRELPSETALGAAAVDDFASGTDEFAFYNSMFTRIGTVGGDFSAGDGRFYAAAGATGGHDVDDRIIYDTSTGNLYYDEDGSGTGAGLWVATLGGAPSLTASDIHVIDDSMGDGGMSIVGGPSDDDIDGSNGHDTIRGFGGDDTLNGYGGNDYLIGTEPGQPFNDEANVFNGGEGDDTLESGGRHDTLNGDAGDDDFLFVLQPINGIWNYTTVTDFGDGEDRIVLDLAIFTQLGEGGTFSPGDGRFYAAPGAAGGHDADDRIIYDTTDGTLYYDADGNGAGIFAPIARLEGAPTLAASDIVVIGDLPDPIVGTSGDDTLNGTVGEDTIVGGAGDDVLNGDEGQDLLIGGEGNDTLHAPAGAHGDGWADVLDGGMGDDHYWVSDDGDHTLVDSGGIDTVHAVNSPWTLGEGIENLELISTSDGGADGVGNDLANVITSGSFSWLQGLGGDDLLDAGRGSRLEGGAGNDTLIGAGELSGGAGNDRFTFYPPFVGDDPVLNDDVNITDFATGSDRIQLDGQYGGDIGPSGSFSAGDARFWSSGSGLAHDASDRVIYNTSTGELWYDEDGSGSEAARRIAFVDGAPTLTATDIEVVNGAPPPTNVFNGTEGNDSLTGTAGNDTLNGLGGNDTLRGLAGADVLDGGLGIDSMDGGAGDDRYVATAGDVLVDAAGGGTDLVESFASWTLGANFENLTLLAGAVTANGNELNNVLRGNEGNNTSINGRAGNDTMFGMGGNDVFDMSTGGTSSYGNDVIDGGTGVDSVEFGANARTAVTINLAAGTVAGGGDAGAGGATLTGVENALGGNFNDTFIGNSAANYFRGSNGNDTMNGGAGNDRLQGDAGNDAFVFDFIGAANSDTVIGFASGVDKVHLENAVMTALGAAGNFTAGDVRYWEAAGATSGHDANDRIVYNTTNGNLYYDADGSGSGAAQLIATVQGAPAFTDTDVFVI